MSTAAVIIGILLVILSMGSVCLCALIVFRALESTNRLVSSMHERNGKMMDKTLDRLMTIDWERFVYRGDADVIEYGGQSLPSTPSGVNGGLFDAEEEITQLVPGAFGRLRAMIDDTTTEDEEEMLREDFPEGSEEVRT